jgi:prepilin-type N-terminal cleavage/methylation domain-containing protein
VKPKAADARIDAAGDEAGFSLVETLIAVVIFAVAGLAAIGGLMTSVSSASLHRQQSVANTVMLSAAETIKTAPYVPCATTYSVSGVNYPTGWSASNVAVSVQWVDPATGTPSATCLDGSAVLYPGQLVTITVTSPGPQATTSVTIVKRST